MDVQPVTADVKKQIQKLIIETILNGVSSQQFTLVSMKEAAAYTLDNIDIISNYNELMVFLQNLSKWNPAFDKINTIYKYEKQGAKEKEIIDKLSSYIKQMN